MPDATIADRTLSTSVGDDRDVGGVGTAQAKLLALIGALEAEPHLEQPGCFAEVVGVEVVEDRAAHRGVRVVAQEMRRGTA